MLGNIRPYMPALDEEAKKRYSAVYCGLCTTLGRQNGICTRFVLSYDMAFTAIVYDAINKEPFNTEYRGCFANPVKKKDILLPTKGTAFAADILVMLAYFKLADNILDEKLLKKAGSMLVSPYFRIKYSDAAARHPALAAVLKRESERQQQLEKESRDVDRLCLPTSEMVKAIMMECRGDNKNAIGQFGFFLGRVIYLLDALCDMQEDEKENRFNIFNINCISREDAKAECFMALGEMSYWYRQLELESNKDIIDNIIYLSLARQIKFAGEEEKEENNGQ